ncbi:MAG: alpha/beta hydrolase [Acidobacteriaceae bacterium]
MPKPPKRKLPSRQSIPSPPATEAPPTVSARWLLTAIATALGAAAFCGYAALCLLFYQGQWQMLFHPSRTIAATPATAGMSFDDVRFDVTETGLPQLDGWWIPAQPFAQYSSATVLYLHDGSGSLSDTIPTLSALHTLGINVFAIDYRGFGRSTGTHPTERLGIADSIAAWTWLTDTRHTPASNIVVFGDGVGVTFAAHLAAEFTPAGVILADPSPSARQVFASDARASILPLFLLQKEKLDPSGDLARSHVPRLFLDRRGNTARTRSLFEGSSDPKTFVDLRTASNATVDDALRRFLDENLR